MATAAERTVVEGPFEEDWKNNLLEDMKKKVIGFNKLVTAAFCYSERVGVTKNSWYANLYGSHSCHNGMSDSTVRTGPMWAAILPNTHKKLQEEAPQSMARFLYESEESPYAPIINRLGRDKGFHVVKKDGVIYGFVVSDNTVSMKLLMALAKSTRAFSEHEYMFAWWNKWVLKKGLKPSGLLWVLGFCYSLDGSKRYPNHSPVEQHAAKEFNLRRLLGRFVEDEWEFDVGPMKTSSAYTGENAYMWSYDPLNKGKKGMFDAYTHIRKAAAKKPVPTVFYKKYFEKSPDQLSDLDIETFIKAAYAGEYDEYIK